jgi:PAS domain S-box-containing protein
MAGRGERDGGNRRPGDSIETWVGDGTLRERGESEERRALRTLLRNLPGFVYRCCNDRDWTIEYISPQCFDLTGYGAEDFLSGRITLGQLMDPDDADEVWRSVQACIAEDRPFQLTYRLHAADGSVKHVWEQGIAVPGDDGLPRLEGFVWDVTVQRQCEEELIHARRVEAVGRLAGGVAHDFNNLLTVIASYVALLHRKVEPDLQRDLDEIGQAAQRGAELTRQLLAFTRRQEIEPRIIAIDDAVAGVETMLRRLVHEHIELRFDLAAPGACCHIDRGQLEVALTNLAVNARDAMPGGGLLEIATRSTELVEDDGELRAGHYAVITVADDGVGMDAATRRHLFEPFFTTKPAGRGTGLGMATVMRIVNQASGHLRVESAPGRGTRFDLYLPRSIGERVRPPTPAPGIDAPGGTERILVVEDMPVVRKLCTRILRHLGYTVLEAPTPEQALVVAAGAPDIDLLLTDVVMPQMAGPALAEELRRTGRALQVVYMSGYPEDLERERARSRAGETFLAKPFSPEELGRAIRTALTSQPRP